jgi:hypothetical protein
MIKKLIIFIINMEDKYKDIKFENLEWKNTLSENEIDPEEKKRVDDLIEQLRIAVDRAVNYWKDGKK